MKQTLKLLALSMLAAGLFALVKTPVANAATLTVNSNADTAVQDDGNCTFREAINNINSGSDTTDGGSGGDCLAGDGSNDTIILPNGTITLTADLPIINHSVVVRGEGMGKTVIDCNGQWGEIRAEANVSNNYSFESFTVKSFRTSGLIVSNGNSSVKNIEIDGTGAAFSGGGSGVGLLNDSSNDNTVTIENLYVHDISLNAGAINVIGVGSGGAARTTLTARNVTVANIENTDPNGAVNSFLVATGLFGGAPGPHGVTGSISNYTVSNVRSAASANALAVIGGAISTSNTETDITLSNATLTGIVSSGNQGGVIGAGGAAIQQGDIASARVRVQNVVLAGNATNGCGALDISYIFGGQGTASGEIVSQGGNLIDNNSCSSYFTHSTDQNNLGNLASTLGTLSNNGGFVPTIPLLVNSPAVDAGVTVAGLTQDARLAVRPQGNAFDSGAYESSFTRPQAALASTGESVMLLGITSTLLIATSAGIILKKRTV